MLLNSLRLTIKVLKISIAVCLFTVFLSALAWAGEFTAFGPQNFIRKTGSPETVTNHFSVLNPNTEFFLRVYNGGLQDTQTDLVSSTVIMLNDSQVVGPAELSQKVKFVEKPVTLSVANTLKVEVRGKPGGSLTIIIAGKDDAAPDIRIIDPADGSVISTNTPLITVDYSDAISGVNTATLEILIDAVASQQSFNITSTQASWQIPAEKSLADGGHNIQVRISDRAGNYVSVGSTFEVRTLPPPPPVTAESGFIHGQVFDAVADLPLERVDITVQGIEGKILTDAQGRFVFPVPQAGQFKLTAQKEGFTLGQRLVEVISTLNANVPPIYLTPLDSKTTLITVAAGGTATDSTGALELNFPPGAVPYDVEVRATALQSLKDLPAPQGDFLVFLFGADLQAAGISNLNQPVELKVANRLNLPAGYQVPLTFWNENTLNWDNAGAGIVTADAAWIKFTITHFSIYHSNSRALSSKADAGSQNKSSTGANRKHQEAVDPIGWIVGYHKGNLYYSHNLPTVRTLGVSEGLSLTYNSITANPSFLILNETSQPSGTAPDRLGWSLDIEGIHREIKFAGSAPTSRQAFLWDAHNANEEIVRTGSYLYTLNISNEFNSGTFNYVGPDNVVRPITVNEPIIFPNKYKGRANICNQINSPLGAGWSLTQLQRLHLNPDGTILLTQGDGYSTLFTPGRPDLKEEILAAKESKKVFDALPIAPSTRPYGEHYTFAENTVTVDLQPGQKAIISSTPDGKGGIVVDNYMLINGVNKNGLGWFSGAIGPSSNGMPVDTFLAPLPPVEITDLLTVGTNELNFKLMDYGGGKGATDLFLVIVDAAPLPFEITQAVPLFEPIPIHASLLEGQTYPFATKLAQVNLQPGQSAYLSSTPDGKGDWIADNYLSIDGVKASDGYSRVFGGYPLPVGAPVESAYEGVPSVNVTEFIPQGDCRVRFDLMDFGGWYGASRLYLIVGNDRLFTSADESTLIRNEDGTFTRRMKDGTQIKFNSAGLHIQTIDRNGNVTSYAYDAQDRVVSITDAAGRITQFNYDAAGRLASIIDAAGRTTEFNIDSDGDIVSIRNPDNSTESFAYNSKHLLTALTDGRGAVTEFVYDEFGRINQVITPQRQINQDGVLVTARETRRFQPGETKELINSIPAGEGTAANPTPAVFPEDITDIFIDGKGYTTVFKTDKYGAILEEVNALGEKTSYERDEKANPFKITRANGAITTLTYDSQGSLLTTTESGIGVPAVTHHEPSFDRVNFITDPNRNVTRINYDQRGNPVKIIDALDNATTMIYDSRGLLTAITDAFSNLTQFTYDDKGNLISTVDPLSRTATLSHDPAGNVLSSTDPAGRTTTYAYDIMNRLTSVIDPAGNTTRYQYDTAGNLIAVTDAQNHTTTFEYDAAGLLSKVTNPPGFSKTFTYDANRNLASTTDANGQRVTFDYNAINKLVTKTLPDEETTIFTYDNVGNLKAVNNPHSQLSFDYDLAGRMITSQTAGYLVSSINYSYDNAGSRTSMSSPAGTVNYYYDALNRLASLTNPSIRRVNYTYDSLSRRTGLSITTPESNVSSSYAYDNAGQLLSINRQLKNTTQTYNYAYDNVSNRTNILDPQGVHNYTYDALNRLTQATNPAESFAYDKLGNHNPALFTYDAGNRLLEDDQYTYTYDNNGNLTSKTSKTNPTDITTYTYNVENQLIQVTNSTSPVTSYKYDGLGRRIEKNSGGLITRYLYDHEDLLCEYNSTNTLIAKYTHGPGIDEPLFVEKDNQSFYYHADALGSITTLTDWSGSIVKTYSYDSFGNIISSTGSVDQPYTYTGREYDTETGLYYYRARYYDARMGRFLQEDPLFTTNLYVYVANNPINFVDPWGLSSIKKTRRIPKALFIFVPGYRKYGGPSRNGPGEPEDIMDAMFQRHDFGYEKGGMDKADIQLLYELSTLPNNPKDWGEGVSPIYAKAYYFGAKIYFSGVQVITQALNYIKDVMLQMEERWENTYSR